MLDFVTAQRIVSRHDLRPQDLISLISETFSCEIEQSQRWQETLDNQLAALQYEHALSVLVFDDAEKLSDPILLTLLNLIDQQSEHQMKFHVLLFG